MPDNENAERSKHHHRGKTSESIVNKTEILKKLNITPGQKILDAGCGNGYMAKEFARLAGEAGKVYALDLDPVSISALKSENGHPALEPFVGDITKETKFEPSCLDLIYISTVTHGFSHEQMDGFVDEVQRILKPSGKLAVVEMQEDAPFGPPIEIRLSPEKLRQKISLKPLDTIKAGQFLYMQIFEN